MRRCHFICLLSVCTVAFASVTVAQTVITPSSATNTSWIGSAGRSADKLVDGSGLSGVGDILTQTHGISDNDSADYWLSASGNPGTNTFVLPAATDIDAIYVWQYNRSIVERQVVSFSLAFSTDGTTYPTTITGLSLATVPGTAPILPQTVTFSQQSGVTHIKMVDMVNGGDGFTGLCEVRFGSGVGLPAPNLISLDAETITETSADLVGKLVDGAADVRVFWDTENKGENFTWAHTNSPVDAYTNTAAGTTITNHISGLTPGQTNYFAFYASNATDTAWAFSSFVSTPQTDVITPYHATASSTFDAIRVVGRTIDSSGLTAVGDVATWTHDNLDNTYWMATVASSPVLTYWLPGVANVDGVYLWQGGTVARQLNTFDISFSTDNGDTFANTVSGLSLVSGTNIAQLCTFQRKAGITHIRLSNLTSSDTYVNLGEIRFRRAGPPAGTVISIR